MQVKYRRQGSGQVVDFLDGEDLGEEAPSTPLRDRLRLRDRATIAERSRSPWIRAARSLSDLGNRRERTAGRGQIFNNIRAI